MCLQRPERITFRRSSRIGLVGLECVAVRRRTLRKSILIALLLIPTIVSAQRPQNEDAEDPPPASVTSPHFQFKFKERPSFRMGEFIRVDVKTKWHFDWLQYSPPVVNPPGTTLEPVEPAPTYELTRARFGLKGKVSKYFDWEIEREMRNTFSENQERHPWKDVYVDFKPAPFVQFKVGKFKLPFGMSASSSLSAREAGKRN